MKILHNNKMAELIHLNYNILSILYRFDIKLGFGDKTIDEVCKEHNINTKFFLEIANAFINKDYSPEDNLQNFSIELIVNYLQKTHIYYTKEKIPEILKLINNLKFKTNSQRNIDLLKDFFTQYSSEFNQHIKREDDFIYPYVISLQKAFDTKQISKADIDLINKKPISSYQIEHENVEEKLYDLKNILIKYLPPATNQKTINIILSKLFKLEDDLNEHTRIENKVMIPKAIKLEKIILTEIKQNKIKII